MVTYILLGLLVILVLPAIALYLLVIYHLLFRKKKFPADSSNRINHIRLFWFSLTREDKFVPLFPWLKNDEWDNLEDK